jgi:primosomal protein N' (replication factor Y) (superfamily II helicase)
MYAEVLTEYSVKSLDKTFTYLIPNDMQSILKVGMKVVVPFGKQTINGFVINIKESSDLTDLKSIISITNPDLILNEELIKLGFFLKENTLCSLITAYQTMLPSSMKVKTITSNYQKYNEYLVLSNNPDNYIKNYPRRLKQIELLNRLKNNEVILKNEYDSNIINTLVDENLIIIKKEIKYRINNDSLKENKLELTDEQTIAVNKISASFDKTETFLVHGVTGSGKTEVYMNLIDKVIKLNQTALVLVPEISLTTQIIDRFYQRFGNDVAVFHSALSDGEKYDEYHKIMIGDVHIVVGTRSSVFVPLKNIGIIIIDEEQSTNYKQDNNPRYNAKDIAIERSKYHHCPLVLGSATPSLESYARAQKRVFTLIELKNRIGNAKLPETTIVDMQEEYKKRNMIISDLLNEKILDRLNKHEQIMILLNRRGFTTIMTCKNCGYTFKCPHCDITLTYHKTSNNLRCHYCGYTLSNPEECPDCHEKALTSYGLGTEKLEEEIKIKYPNARVIRMDADTTTKKGSTKSIIDKIQNEDVDIIIGTQMISKGFDFPKITLIGIVNADESLNIPDFRSGERTFELLSQTSGRAGRSNLPGEVIIQTFNPNNKTLSFVKNNDYISLYEYEINIRKLLKYPPYYYLTIIKIASKDYDEASKESRKTADYLTRYLKDVIILGPTTAGLFKINNIYRFQIILKYKNYDLIKNTLINLDNIYKTNSKVNIEIDNNPCRI